jgi:hypothetical protein
VEVELLLAFKKRVCGFARLTGMPCDAVVYLAAPPDVHLDYTPFCPEPR